MADEGRCKYCEGELTGVSAPEEYRRLIRMVNEESDVWKLTHILNTTRRRVKRLIYDLEMGLIDNPDHQMD